jgi:hypothetical protein
MGCWGGALISSENFRSFAALAFSMADGDRQLQALGSVNPSGALHS